MAVDNVTELHQKLKDCLSRVKLGAAGRFVGYDLDLNMFILYMHTTSPEKTQEATELAFRHIYGTESNPK